MPDATSKTTGWRAAVWDKPQLSPARYYVVRGDEALTDERGGVMTFASRVEAERRAREENGNGR